MNTVKLIGNVGRTPNIRNFETSKLASFSIATNETYENKDAETVTTTQWHNIVAWGKIAETCETMLESGKLISVEGKLRTRHYMDTENRKIYITEVLAQRIDEVQPKKKEKMFFL